MKILFHKEFKKTIGGIQKKLIENLDKKLEEINKVDKPKFESSIFH